MMYEMLVGKHPILLRDEAKSTYKLKMESFTGLELDTVQMSDLAKNLLEKLCKVKPGHRYRVE